MSILGSIVVELKAQTASFIDGMNAAAKTSRSVGREIESSFSELGDVASKALAPFGAMGAAIAETLGQIGSAAGGAIQSFGKMGGVIGGVAAIGGGAAAALGAVSLGAIALATSTAESIAKMGELSQSTGISVGALSSLAFAGKTVGLSIEQVSGGLEKMDKAVLKAATSPAGAVSAFSRLHLSLRDVSGQIKPTEEIFGELAGRFSTMPDGITKTALAMQIFGRSGAEMLPMLNKGKAGIDDLVKTAAALGIALDDQTVQASQKFKESLATIEAAGQGLAIQLTKDLLPALQTVAEFLVSGLKDKNSTLSTLIDDVAWLTKAFLTLGDVIFAWFQTLESAVGHAEATFIEFGSAAGKALSSAATLDWTGLVSAWKEGQLRLSAVSKQGADETTQIWANASKFIHGVWSPLAPATPAKPGGTKADTSPADRSNIVLDTIAKLQAQRDEEALLAATLGTVASANLLATAAAEAGLKIAELEIAAKKKHISVSDDQKKAIIDLTVATAGYKAIVEDNKALTDYLTKTDEQISSTRALADAYATANPEIIRNAEALAKVAPIQQKIAQLQEFISNFHGSSKDLAAFTADLSRLQEKLEEAKIQSTSVVQKEGLLSAGKQVASSQPFEATQQRISDLDLLKAREQQFGKDVTAIDAVIYQEKIRYVQEYMQYVFQTQNAELLGNARLYDSQISLIRQWDDAALKIGTFGQRFQGVMNELMLQGREAGAAIQKAFETAIDGVETQLAKLMTGQKANFKQVFQGLAESVAKAEIQKAFGSIGEAITGKKSSDQKLGTFNNPMYVTLKGGLPISLGGASSVPGAFGTGMDGSSGSGGVVGKLSSALGLNKFSSSGGGEGGGKSGGTSGLSAFFSKALGAPEGAIDKFLTRKISSLFVASRAAASQTALGGAGALAGGGVGAGIGMGEDAAADVSSIFSTFGGLMAGGGDVSPGKSYIVGEKRPELFTPRTAGRITPELPNKQPARMTNITNNFNFPEKPDLMKKSQNQLNREQYRQMSLAHSRG